MCKCIIGILLSDLITMSLLYTAFIELNLSDEHYNIIKLFNSDYDFEGKLKCLVIMVLFMVALIVHTLAIAIKYILKIVCCCCCSDREDSDLIFAWNTKIYHGKKSLKDNRASQPSPFPGGLLPPLLLRSLREARDKDGVRASIGVF